MIRVSHDAWAAGRFIDVVDCRESHMRAFVAGTVAMIAIAVVAAVVLNSVGFSAADTFSTVNVRL